MSDVERLIENVLAGDTRSLAKVISMVESRSSEAEKILAKLSEHVSGKPVIGISGAPGVGKSSLIGWIVGYLRKKGLRVAVLALDPSSPFTGGAVLGDRVRMASVSSEPGVYIRSMATRGAAGSVVAYVRAVLRVFDAAGFDVLLVETVGAGQSDVAINDVADVVAIVVTPDLGDSIQTIKAGLLEIGDVYVVNKADDVRSSNTAAILEAMLSKRGAKPVVMKTVAISGEGVGELAETLLKTWERLKKEGELQSRRKKQAIAEVLNLVLDDLRVAVQNLASDKSFIAEVEQLVDQRLDPKIIAGKIRGKVLESIKKG